MKLIQNAVELATRDVGVGGRGAHLVILSLVGPVLATILVFNRIYWRMSLVRTLGLDDLCITLSLFFLYLLCIANIVAVDHGYGRPSKSLSKPDLHIALQMFYLDQIFYKLTINLTKLSILCLYLRIFTQPWFRRTCWSCVIVVSTYALASIVATIFQCTPIPHLWDKTTYPTATCINVTAFWYANAIYNVITDIVILASVPGVVWKLKLPFRQKLALTVVFGLGTFVCATSILRMTTLGQSSKALDLTQGTLLSTMWTTIEASTAIVCACLPMLRTPVQRLVPRLFPSQTAGGTGRKGKRAPVAKTPAIVPTGAGASAHGVESVPTESVQTTSANDSATWMAADAGAGVVSRQIRSTDLEMGMGMPQSHGWPTRLSGKTRLNGLMSGSGPPTRGLGRRRLLSESSGCASPPATKLEEWW